MERSDMIPRMRICIKIRLLRFLPFAAAWKRGTAASGEQYAARLLQAEVVG